VIVDNESKNMKKVDLNEQTKLPVALLGEADKQFQIVE
jgi:hypothetical protein